MFGGGDTRVLTRRHMTVYLAVVGGEVHKPGNSLRLLVLNFQDLEDDFVE